MKKYNTLKLLLLIIGFFLLDVKLNAQIVNTGKTIELHSPQQSFNSQVYKARDYITLSDGFSSKPNINESFNARIDQSLTLTVDYSNPSVDPASPDYPLNRTLNTSSKAVGSLPGSFNVSPTGAATYNIPIDVPPGTNGMTPQLSIMYNSQGGDGDMGLGWGLAGISAITRANKTIYQNGAIGRINLSDNDNIALDGQSLISNDPALPGLKGSEFYTQSESFVKISLQGSGDSRWFKVETKDGRILEYGKTGDSRQKVRDGANQFTISWMLNKVTDSYGNYIEYKYLMEGYDEFYGELHLRSIEYNKRGAVNPGNQIFFMYDARKDNWESQIGSFRIRRSHVLSQINVTGNGQLTATYRFTYTNEGNEFSTRLYEIVKEDGKGNALNSTQCTWTSSPAISSPKINYTGVLGEEGLTYFSGDFNGDGITDMLSINQNFECHFNPSNSNGPQLDLSKVDYLPRSDLYTNWVSYVEGKCSNPPTYPDMPKEFNDVKRILMGDFDGDGAMELLEVVADLDFQSNTCEWLSTVYFPGQIITEAFLTKGYKCHLFGFDKNEGVLIEKASFDFYGIPENIVIDFNQDGKPDILLGSDVYSFNSGTNSMAKIGSTQQTSKFPYAFWGDFNLDSKLDFLYGDDIYTWNGTDYQKSGTISGADIRTCLGVLDYNGDGKTDYVILEDAIEYKSKIDPSTGKCYPDLNARGCKLFPFPLGYKFLSINYGYGLVKIKTYSSNYPTKVLPCNINADGFTDLIVITGNKITSCFVSKSSGFAQANEITLRYDEIPLNISISNNTAYGDFNGDGFNEFFDIGNGVCYSFANGNPTRMVNGIIDGFNRKTVISYKPLTDLSVYTMQSTASIPVMDFSGALYVVNDVKTDDGKGGNIITSYTYEGAKLHMEGKGFLGFAKTTQSNVVANRKIVTTSQLESTYFTLAKQTTEVFTLDNKLISKSINDFDIKVLDATQKHIFPYLKTSENINNLGDVSKTEYILDNNGNIVTETTKVNTDFSVVVKAYGTFNSFGKPESVTATSTRKGEPAVSQTTSYTYLETGAVETQTTNGLTTTFKYDDFGNANSVTLGTGDASRETTMEYDDNGCYMHYKTNAKLHKGETTRDFAANTVTQKDANGLVSISKYDSWGRLVQAISPDGKIATQSLNWASGGDAPEGALYYASSTNDGNFAGAEYFDALGHTLRKVSVGFGGIKFYTDTWYNVKGQVTDVTDPYPASEGSTTKITTYHYDDFGRIDNQTSSNGVTVTNTYSGKTISTAYSTGERYSKTYDAAGLVTQANDPGGNIVYTYTSAGQPRVIETSGSKVEMTYWPNGLQKTLTDPNAGATTYGYNIFGELETQTNAKGTTTTAYDKLGRIATKTIAGVTTTYTYDATNALGQLERISDSNTNGAITQYTFGDYGRVASSTKSKDGVSFIYNYEYDEKGRLKRLIYPNNFATKYKYNSNNDLVEIDDDDNNLIWKNDGVNTKGQLQYAKYGNQLTTEYSYDAQDRLNRIYVPNVIDFNYEFNDKQQLNYRDEKYYNTTIWKGFRESFTYDEVNRLKKAFINDVEIMSMAYKQGVNDRIDKKSDVGVYNYQANNHKVDNVAPVDGYQPPDHIITYTAEGKVETVAEGNKLLTLDYGNGSERFKAVYAESGTTQYTRYYFDSYEKEVKADGTERHLNYIYAGGGLVAIYEQKTASHKMHYVFIDYLGSVRCITSQDGAVEQRLSYDAYGNRRDYETGEKYATAPTDLLFARGYTGHEHMDEFGLINMNGRVYDPMLAMFLSPDIYINDPSNSQDYNRYTYCLNNPLMYTDPSGYTWFSHFFGWVGENAKTIITAAVFVVVAIVATPVAIFWAGTYAMNMANNMINSHMSFSEAYNNTPMVVGFSWSLPITTGPPSDGNIPQHANEDDGYSYYQSEQYGHFDSNLDQDDGEMPIAAYGPQVPSGNGLGVFLTGYTISPEFPGVIIHKGEFWTKVTGSSRYRNGFIYLQGNVDPKFEYGLAQHEYGHYLQEKQLDKDIYHYFEINSFLDMCYYKAGGTSRPGHQFYFVETDANIRAAEFFKPSPYYYDIQRDNYYPKIPKYWTIYYE